MPRIRHFMPPCAFALTLAALSFTASAVGPPTAKPESVGMSSERLARIDASMQRHIAAGDIVGGVTAVSRHGKLVHFQSHGQFDLDAKSPMPRDAIFRLASSSKPITAVAVLILAEEGKLRLSDNVSQYVPELKNMKVAVARAGTKPDVVAAEREITIHDLLTHTAGLLSNGMGQSIVDVPRDSNGKLADFAPKLNGAILDFQPGKGWAYSRQAGIDLAGRIVEIVSGQSLDVFLRERIFKPLGMNSTGFVLPAEQRARLVPFYAKAEGKWSKSAPPPGFVSETFFSGAGGLMSTAGDYLAFELMRLNGGEFNGQRLLSPKSTQLMAMNHVGTMFNGIRGDEKCSGFGLAVSVVLDETCSLWHRTAGSSGWYGAFGTMTWVDPKEDLVAVLMINQSNRGVQLDFNEAVMQAIVKSEVK